MTASTNLGHGLEDDSYKWRAFTAIGISFVTNVAAMSMVFVALSAIADDFGVTLGTVAWVVIVQALVISALMLPMGRFADIVGRKRIHLTGLVLFAGGALLVAFAPTFELLIAARVVMAVGNSMGQPVGTAMVVSVFPEHERGKAIGAQTTAVAIGGASGPIIAGLVLQVLPWQALFIGLTIPIAVAFVAAVILLDEERVSYHVEGERPPFDWGGALLSGVCRCRDGHNHQQSVRARLGFGPDDRVRRGARRVDPGLHPMGATDRTPDARATSVPDRRCSEQPSGRDSPASWALQLRSFLYRSTSSAYVVWVRRLPVACCFSGRPGWASRRSSPVVFRIDMDPVHSVSPASFCWW